MIVDTVWALNNTIWLARGCSCGWPVGWLLSSRLRTKMQKFPLEMQLWYSVDCLLPLLAVMFFYNSPLPVAEPPVLLDRWAGCAFSQSDCPLLTEIGRHCHVTAMSRNGERS